MEQRNPRYLAPSGQIYTCIFYAVSIRSGWEWYGFEVVEKSDDDTIYFGFVHGFDDEFGNFSRKELEDNNVEVCTDPEDLRTLMPPVGWFRHDN